jgi:hypothetical protein
MWKIPSYVVLAWNQRAQYVVNATITGGFGTSHPVVAWSVLRGTAILADIIDGFAFTAFVVGIIAVVTGVICHWRIAEYAFDVHAWSFACPHPFSLFRPVPALEQDVSHCLFPESALAPIRVRFVDSMEIGPQADFAVSHLGDDRTDRAMRAGVHLQRPFPWPNACFPHTKL